MNRIVTGGVSISLAMVGIFSCSENNLTGVDSRSDTVDVGGLGLAATATTNPGTVSDLKVVSADSTSVTLSFTQVDDGTGQPAKYDVRYAFAPIAWGSAQATTSGTCTTPVAGTAIGATLTCAVFGLRQSANYNFQLVPFRGVLNQSAVFGGLSNVVAATTVASTGRAPVNSVTVSPASAPLQVGSKVQLSVTTRDSSGNILTGRSVAWTSNNPSVASVSSSGLVTGVAAGSGIITATSEGKSGSATVTVASSTSPGAVADLRISTIDSNSVTLSFTQVNDGTGLPAKYDIRYAVAPISWGSATATTTGSCKTPVAGTAIGNVLTCMVLGLRSSTNYNFQLVAFRGTLNQSAVFGRLSNIASATTKASATLPPVPVASVTVSPASASLQVGSSVQLSATTRDANNNVLTGRTITWSSSNTGIASVSASGLVTAVAAGGATITATSESKIGTSAISATAASTSNRCGNEPTGMARISERPFNSLGENSAWDTDNTLSIVSDPAAPISPSNVIRATYPAGWPAGSEPGHTGLTHQSYAKIYICFAFKLSSNWVGNGSGTNKMMYEWTVNPNKPAFFFSAQGIGNGPLAPWARLQDIVTFPGGNGNLAPNLVPSAQIIRGRWHQVEIFLQGNTSGSANGTIDWYLDGVHVGSVGGVGFSSGAASFYIFEFRPIWGGTNTSPAITSTQTMDWDNVYISGKN